MSQPHCAVCGYELGHINEACPRCLPGFYTQGGSSPETPKPSARELAERAWKDVLSERGVYVGVGSPLGGPVLAARDAAISVLLRLLSEMQEENARLKGMLAELEAYREAAQYDAMMEGPRFKGWNRSQLDRARKLTESHRLAARDAPPK